jgi:hypothetical protein
MNSSDSTLPQTEDQIPALAAMAVEQAFRDALAAGQSVLIAESGFLVEISPDGGRRVVKRIAPNIPVTAGQIISLK